METLIKTNSPVAAKKLVDVLTKLFTNIKFTADGELVKIDQKTTNGKVISMTDYNMIRLSARAAEAMYLEFMNK